MEKITTTAELKFAIKELKLRQAAEWPQLKEQFLITCEDLKPLNIIKNTFKDFVTPPIKNDLMNVGVGMTAGFITKSLLFGFSQNPLKKIVGNFLEMGVSALVAKNPETVKNLLDKVMGLFNKHKTEDNT